MSENIKFTINEKESENISYAIDFSLKQAGNNISELAKEFFENKISTDDFYKEMQSILKDCRYELTDTIEFKKRKIER